MAAQPPSPMLARLRGSARLAVFVLLVFTLKIASAAACAKHDYQDMGLGSTGDYSAVAKAADGDDPAQTVLGHGTGCSHCSCHHASAVPSDTSSFAAAAPRELVGYATEPPLNVSPREALRPPIA